MRILFIFFLMGHILYASERDLEAVGPKENLEAFYQDLGIDPSSRGKKKAAVSKIRELCDGDELTIDRTENLIASVEKAGFDSKTPVTLLSDKRKKLVSNRRKTVLGIGVVGLALLVGGGAFAHWWRTKKSAKVIT